MKMILVFIVAVSATACGESTYSCRCWETSTQYEAGIYNFGPMGYREANRECRGLENSEVTCVLNR